MVQLFLLAFRHPHHASCLLIQNLPAELQVLLDSSLESAEICANEAVPSCGKLKCRSHPKHEDGLPSGTNPSCFKPYLEAERAVVRDPPMSRCYGTLETAPWPNNSENLNFTSENFSTVKSFIGINPFQFDVSRNPNPQLLAADYSFFKLLQFSSVFSMCVKLKGRLAVTWFAGCGNWLPSWPARSRGTDSLHCAASSVVSTSHQPLPSMDHVLVPNPGVGAFLQTSLTSVCLKASAVDKLPLSGPGCAGGRNHNPGCPLPAASEVAHMSSPLMCFSSSGLLPLRPTSKSIHFNLDNMSEGTSTAGSYEEEVPSIWVQNRHNSFLYRHTGVYILQIYLLQRSMAEFACNLSQYRCK
ncbi:hypothetical protein Anapl_05589 [Anas platyrhynchos]|uniref:Uncharacterized protein n=1 Tax=Anas platyrhynchos TaxID=8839 RepID=R0LN40_ANAPL|nr:hypothetical protein Anapl_05589 [Anas platyrhynchos]